MTSEWGGFGVMISFMTRIFHIQQQQQKSIIVKNK